MRGRVLIVAGSDSGGGAGIQADIKTVTALGGFAATAVTALTAQDTTGVHDVFGVPPAFIARQMEVVLADIGADAIKTGMLHTAAVIGVVAGVLEKSAPDTPLVVDPVMFAKGGARLLDPAAEQTLRERLLPRATVITPNVPEAEVLLGWTIDTPEALEPAARALLPLGPRGVLLKGGGWRAPWSPMCSPPPRASAATTARGSRPATCTAPAAPWPRPWPPAWPGGWRWRRRWRERGPSSRPPSAPRRASAPATAPSTTPCARGRMEVLNRQDWRENRGRPVIRGLLCSGVMCVGGR